MDFLDKLKKYNTTEYFNLFLKTINKDCIGLDGLSIEKITINFFYIMEESQKSIKNKNFCFVPFKLGYIYKRNGKLRKISILSNKDKYLDRVTYDFLNAGYNTPSIHNISNSIYSTLKPKKRFYLRCDIKDFFASINHKILLSKIDAFNDDYLISLIKSFISTPTLTKQEFIINKQSFGPEWYKLDNFSNKIGVPQGAAISQALSNIYLNEFDNLLKTFAHKYDCNYYRYCDDICLLANDNRTIESAKDLIITEINKLKLTLNEEKLNYGAIEESFDYLGFNYNLDMISVSTKSLQFIKENILKFYQSKLLFFKRNESDLNISNPEGLRNWIKFALPLNNAIRGFNPEWFYQFNTDCYGLARHLSIINNYDQIKELEKWLGRLNKYYCIKICEELKHPLTIINLESLTNWFFRYKKNHMNTTIKAYTKYCVSTINLSIPYKKINLVTSLEEMYADSMDSDNGQYNITIGNNTYTAIDGF